MRETEAGEIDRQQIAREKSSDEVIKTQPRNCCDSEKKNRSKDYYPEALERR